MDGTILAGTPAQQANAVALIATLGAAIALFMGTAKTLFPSLTGGLVFLSVLIVCALFTFLAYSSGMLGTNLIDAIMWGAALFQASIGSREAAQAVARTQVPEGLQVRSMLQRRGP